MNPGLSPTDLEAVRLALWRLSVEVSTQLDLWYDDEEFQQMEHAFETLAIANETMHKLGFTSPPTIARMMGRFERSKV